MSEKTLIFTIFILVISLILFLMLMNNIFNTQEIKNTNNIENTIVQENKNEIENKTNETSETPIMANKEIQNNIEDNIENSIVENSIEKNEIIEEPIASTDPEKKREFGSNVAFIGDSRTQAFLMYTGLKEVRDYTNIGLMVDTAITKKFITNSKGEKITILEDLKNRDIDTIYIMLGVNELGWVYSSIFIDKYEELIDKIREEKPNCEIIVQSIIPVTKKKSDSDKIYNNTRITEYNTLIKEMTSRKNVKFIDLTSALTNADGNLPEEASPDGIHLNKQYCLKWLECLKNN